MFVRWKRRVSRPLWHAQRNDQDHIRYAVVVRSERVDGKPRQRIVKYLGGIRESYVVPAITDRLTRRKALYARQRFWRSVPTALASLDLPGHERDAIEAKIDARVPRLTAEEEAELAWTAAAARAMLQGAMGIHPARR